MKELSDLQGKTSCDHCPYKTDSSDKLRTHLQRTRRCAEARGKVAHFKCRNCPFTTFIAASMRRHEESGERACNVQRSKADLRALGGRKDCPDCPFQAASAEHLRSHLRRNASCSRARAMKELSDLQGKTACEYCDYRGSSADKLLKHLKNSRRCKDARGDVKAAVATAYSCPDCPFSTTTPSALQNHRKRSPNSCAIQRNMAGVRALNGRLDCPHCPFKAVKPYTLHLHLQRPKACELRRRREETRLEMEKYRVPA